jgi:hypothetical protein
MAILKLIIGYWAAIALIALAVGIVFQIRRQQWAKRALRQALDRGDHAYASSLMIEHGIAPKVARVKPLVRRVFLWALVPFVVLMIVGALR